MMSTKMDDNMTVQLDRHPETHRMKDFFHRFKDPLISKITAIAVTALILIAGLAVVSLFVFPPLLFTAIPIALAAAVAIIVCIAKRRKFSGHSTSVSSSVQATTVYQPPAPRRESPEAFHLEEQGVVKAYLPYILVFFRCHDIMVYKLILKDANAKQLVEEVKNSILVMKDYLKMAESILGEPLNVATIPEHGTMIETLQELNRQVDGWYVQNHDGNIRQALLDLKQAINNFLT